MYNINSACSVILVDECLHRYVVEPVTAKNTRRCRDVVHHASLAATACCLPRPVFLLFLFLVSSDEVVRTVLTSLCPQLTCAAALASMYIVYPRFACLPGPVAVAMPTRELIGRAKSIANETISKLISRLFARYIRAAVSVFRFRCRYDSTASLFICYVYKLRIPQSHNNRQSVLVSG